MQTTYITPSIYHRVEDVNGKTLAILRISDLVSARLHTTSVSKSWDQPDSERDLFYHLEVNFISKGTFRQESVDFPDFNTCSHALDCLLADLRAWEEYTTGPTYITSMEHFEKLKHSC